VGSAAGGGTETDPFWDRPDIVAKFAGRAPDHRLQRLLAEVDDPPALRVLDLGCAGGRNTVHLAERGVDVHALDAAEAMVARAGERLARVLDDEEAVRRVRRGVMSDLSDYADGAFDLVVALGVMHTATTLDEWERTLDEIARVLKDGGRALVSNFSPASEPEGRSLPSVEGSEHARRWRDGRPMILMDAGELDASFAAHGFRPVEPTETVHVPLDHGFRVTVNALYRLSEPDDPPHATAASPGG